MGRQSRYEIQNYLLYDIRVRTQRAASGALWDVRVDVRRPDGEHCHRIDAGAPAWAQAEHAIHEGFVMGRALIDQQRC